MHVATIKINHTKVSADLTDFPVYVNLADLPASFWDVVANGGGDIRVYKSDDTTELAREVVSCDTATETGELHIKFSGTLSSSSDTDIHIYADGTSSEPATTATYGAENVWTEDFIIVSHDGCGCDSTGNRTFTAEGGVDLGGATGKIGDATSFDGVDDYVYSDRALSGSPTAFTASAFLKTTDADNSSTILGEWNSAADQRSFVLTNSNEGYLRAALSQLGTSVVIYRADTTSIVNNAFHHVVFRYDGSDVVMTVDSVNQTFAEYGTVPANIYNSSAQFSIGALNLSSTPAALGENIIDEIRISSVARSSAWTGTEYENQNSPSTFYTAAAVAGDMDIKNDFATGLLAYWEMEETSGVRYDSHTNGIDLTDNNTVGYATGIIGNCADLDEPSSEYFSVSSSTLDVQGDFSISFWGSLHNVSSPTAYRRIFTGKGGSNVGRLEIAVQNGDGRLVIAYYNAAAQRTLWYSDAQLLATDDVLYHIAITVDVSDTTSGIKVYVNNSPVAGTYVQTFATSLGSHGTNHAIGAYVGGGDEWDGKMDEFGMWNTILSTTDIASIYNGGAGIPYEASGGSSTDQAVNATATATPSITTTKIEANFPEIQESATTASGTRATSHDINLPAGIVSGELLIMEITAAGTTDGDASVELATITTPIGWTQLFNTPYDGALKVRSAVYYRTADETEGSTVTLTTTGARVAGIVHRINNWKGTPEAGTASAGNGTGPNPPSLTPSWGADKNLWIATLGTRAPRTVSASPSGYTDEVAVSTGSVSSSLSCRANSIEYTNYDTVEDPGAWTMDAAVDYVANVIAIQPADVSTTPKTIDATTTASPSVAMQKTFMRTLSETVSGVASMVRSLSISKTIEATVSAVASMARGSLSARELVATVSANVSVAYGTLQSKTLTAVATATAAIIRGGVYTKDVLATVTASATIEKVKTIGQIIAATATATVSVAKGFLFSVVASATVTATTSIQSGMGKVLAVTVKAWVKIKESFWVEKYHDQDDDYHVKY